jgi:hypothetical protein
MRAGVSLLVAVGLLGALAALDPIDARAKPRANAPRTPLKVEMLQARPWVGAFERNFEIARQGYERAVANGADIFVLPEGFFEGYLTGD